MIDWHQRRHETFRPPVVVDSRRRLRICLFVFLAAVVVIFLRVVQLEISYGAGYRAEASRGEEKRVAVSAPRGRILAADGTVLASNKPVACLAVEYRLLQNPSDPSWLRAAARKKLSAKDRKSAKALEDAKRQVTSERDEEMRRLAALAKVDFVEWQARAAKIQARVERMSEAANRRQKVAFEESRKNEADQSWRSRVMRFLCEPPPPQKIIVAEERQSHVLAEDVPSSLIDELTDHADAFPGASIVQKTRRDYPQGTLAAHALGYLGETDDASSDDAQGASFDEKRGVAGLEKQYEAELRGRAGLRLEIADPGGKILSRSWAKEPTPGGDLILSLRPRLQRTAESLLDEAIRKNSAEDKQAVEKNGGAICVIDCRTGAILAAASAPRFDPRWFSASAETELKTASENAAHPLFDRVCQMALPPGSTFKIVTAAALLQTKTVDPQKPFFCQGYLDVPDRMRCEIFVKRKIGHGETTLADALCFSCNVYFFHFAPQLGVDSLVRWADAFGIGKKTGVDLPGESAGLLPNPENIVRLKNKPWNATDSQLTSVGQGFLLTTPLQMLRVVAATANGGRLVTPHFVDRIEFAQSSDSQDLAAGRALAVRPASQPIADLDTKTLGILREGLERVVADPAGTAHDTVFDERVSAAGKTGTAEIGSEKSHAWFVGYAPADDPKVALVVVLEHAGDSAEAAGPVVKKLLAELKDLGEL